MDRYAFSGVVFTSAKPGFDLDWSKQCDVGLPVPDLLVHLEIGAKDAESRGKLNETHPGAPDTILQNAMTSSEERTSAESRGLPHREVTDGGGATQSISVLEQIL